MSGMAAGCCVRFWPEIDDALRRVSLERGVRVRYMAGLYNQSTPGMLRFLRSLADISGAMRADIQVVSARRYNALRARQGVEMLLY